MRSKHILVPLDLMRGSPGALVAVQQMAMENPVQITLLHVVELNIFPPQLNVIDQLRAESRAALRKLAKLFFGASQAAGVVVRCGRPADEIIAVAQERVADLVILGAPKSGITRLLNAGTARRVIRQVPCPTLVLPSVGKPSVKKVPYSLRSMSEESWFCRENPEPTALG